MSAQIDIARRFIDAFNERDLDAFVATLHNDVEIHSGRGLRTGRDEAREWATRSEEGVQQRILLEESAERDHRVLAVIIREWWWEHPDDDHEFAHREEMAWLFAFEDDLVRDWRPFDDRAEAEQAFNAA